MWKRDSCSVLLSLGSHSPDPRTQHPPACLLKHFSVHNSSIFRSRQLLNCIIISNYNNHFVKFELE